MPLKSASVDRIVCDAPFGQKFAVASKSLPQFYKGLILEMYRYKICFLNCSNLSFLMCVCVCVCVCACICVCVCVCVCVCECKCECVFAQGVVFLCPLHVSFLGVSNSATPLTPDASLIFCLKHLNRTTRLIDSIF